MFPSAFPAIGISFGTSGSIRLIYWDLHLCQRRNTANNVYIFLIADLFIYNGGLVPSDFIFIFLVVAVLVAEEAGAKTPLGTSNVTGGSRPDVTHQ